MKNEVKFASNGNFFRLGQEAATNFFLSFLLR